MDLVIVTAVGMFAAAVVLPRMMRLPPDAPTPRVNMVTIGARILVVLGLLVLGLGFWITP